MHEPETKTNPKERQGSQASKKHGKDGNNSAFTGLPKDHN